jgi:hypothetical protein
MYSPKGELRPRDGEKLLGNDPIAGVDPERSVYALVTQRPVWSSVAV